MNTIAIVWGKWGPYHYARFGALAEMYGKQNCLGVALAGKSNQYNWAEVQSAGTMGETVVLNEGEAQEELSALKVFAQMTRILFVRRVNIVFIPSYWPARCLAVLLAARVARCKCIMMNESHALTEKATGIRLYVKKMIIRLFHGGLVGGTPQIAHFTNMGMAQASLFPGYDTVDNRYFIEKSNSARANDAENRKNFGLPQRYILNLGRFVEKKNLSTLVRAYDNFSLANPTTDYSLVLVGSGPQEAFLKETAQNLGLTVLNLEGGHPPVDSRRTVFFAGFRQIEENPIFFALASVFVLPSHTEEWGLVVNEAAACSLPIIVSDRVGSACDLVKPGENGYHFNPQDWIELSRRISDVLDDDSVRFKMGGCSLQIISKWGCDFFASNAVKSIHHSLMKDVVGGRGAGF